MPQRKSATTNRRASRSPSGKLSGWVSGTAGEYFVAAELSRRGYIATLTLRNARGIDILASNADSTRSVGIQVKTTQSPTAEWLASKKVEEARSARNLYFVFVTLNGYELPTYHVVPHRVVARYVRENHKRWVREPKRDGTPRKDTSMRMFRDLEHEYKDAWHLLGLD